MSLLDDVSIVVTPNGYKAGELYAVIPTYAEGAEEITNGDFATDISGWTAASGATLSWVSGKMKVLAADGFTLAVGGQSITTVIGKRYKVVVDVTQGDDTLFELWVGTSLTNGSIYVSGAISSFGVNEFTFIATATTSYINLLTKNGLKFTYFDNVSVKEYTSADMDVTRATAATRVDENGLVNYAEVIGDELVADGSFPTGTSEWGTGTGVTVGSGVATFTSTPSGQSVQQNAVATALPNGSLAKVSFEVLSRTEGSFGIYFSGTLVGSKSSVGVFTAYFTKGTETSFYIRALGTTSGTISNVSVIEEIRDNVPRIDYTGGGCPHILAEPMRTNLITYSEDFSDSSWTKLGAGTGSTSVVTSNYAISPDGEQNASRLQCNLNGGGSSSSNQSLIYDLYSSSGDQTLSIYLKSNNGSNQTIYFANTQTSGDTITVTNEWKRFTFIHSTTNYVFAVGLRGRSGGAIDDTADILIWGAQAEVGSYATSYIPNFGTALGVTRVQDIFTRDGIGSLINSTEGVLFVEMALFIDDDSNKYISLSDTIGENSVQIDFDYSSSRLQYVVNSGNVVQCNIKVSYSGTSMDKFALKWKENDFAVWLNGVEIGIDTSGLAPIGLNTLMFSSPSGSNNFEGKVKQLQVYTTALSDTQLAALTS